MNLRRLVDRAGMPPEAGEAMVRALRGAGYDTADEAQQVTGMTALLAALRVFDALTEPPLQAPYRPGRNDPCPCGSGRKYKKCCGTKAAAAPEPAQEERFVPSSPLEDPQLVPRLHEPESFAEDMTHLQTLFGEEPALDSLRFDGTAVADFVAHRIERSEELWGTGDPDDDTDRVGQLAAQYMQEMELPPILRRLPAAILRAAPEVVRDAQDFRSMALAVALADLPPVEETPGEDGLAEAANPLHALIFRQTLGELLDRWAAALEEGEAS
ncbi:MAG: SEC-C metal-binding domain-containing protein [Thermodesulfobacteriota bacterium]|jgi:hypothetical protein